MTDKMEGELYKKVVPWSNMAEWKTVYSLVYADDEEDQRRGLDHLIGWKARCPSLPAAVECTLCIFQVLHEDPDYLSEKCISVAREQRLRLIYSTAVMRFLNLMLENPSDEDLVGSMYKKAEKLGIPEWIVNLRHDAAHGTSLPDLSLLRASSLFISKWLCEHYWEQEVNILNDWYVTAADVAGLSADEKELNSILEAWEALSLYELAGFQNMNQIPDNELKNIINAIHGMLQSKKDNLKQASRSKVSTAQVLVLQKLARFFHNRPGSVDKASLLVDLIVGGNFLLPSPNLMPILFPNDAQCKDIFQELPSALAECCSGLMSMLWKLGVTPALSSKLITVTLDPKESDLRKNMAALWLQKIYLSCIKVREAGKVRRAFRENIDGDNIYNHYKSFLPGENRIGVLTNLAFAAVEKQRPDLKVGYTWRIGQVPHVLTRLHHLKQVMSAPAKFNHLYLPCLMELISPPLSLRSRKLFLYLFQSKDEESIDVNLEYNTAFGIMSIHENHVCKLNNGEKMYCEEDKDETINKNIKPKARWLLSSGHLEWNKCPLGMLPWQKDDQNTSVPDLFLVGNWKEIPKTAKSESLSGQSLSVSSVRRIKSGRVAKSYIKENTPKKVLKSCVYSPNEKALQFVKSLYN